MSAHVHFDLGVMRAKSEGLLADMLADARSKARTSQDQTFLDLQAKFYQITIDAIILCAESENDGHDREMIGKALGIIVGTIQGQFIGSNLLQPHVAMAFEDYRHGTVTALLSGDKPDGATVSREVRMSPMQGSRA